MTRQLTASEVFVGAVNLSISLWSVFLLASGLALGLGLALTPVYGLAYGLFGSIVADLLVGFLVLGPVFGSLVSVLAAMLVVATQERERVGSVPLTRVIQKSLPLGPLVYLANLRAGIVISAYFVSIVGIPKAVDRLLRWRLVTQAVIIDEASVWAATSLCTEITAGRWSPTLGRIILIRAPTYLLVFFLPAVFAILGAGSVLPWGVKLIGLLWPFVAVGQTLIYFDLRARKAETTVNP